RLPRSAERSCGTRPSSPETPRPDPPATPPRYAPPRRPAGHPPAASARRSPCWPPTVPVATGRSHSQHPPTRHRGPLRPRGVATVLLTCLQTTEPSIESQHFLRFFRISIQSILEHIFHTSIRRHSLPACP